MSPNYTQAMTEIAHISDEKELIAIGHAINARIKLLRNARNATALTTIIPDGAQQYRLSGIRPAHLNGTLVTVTKVKLTRVSVADAQTGRALGTVRASCLTPVSA